MSMDSFFSYNSHPTSVPSAGYHNTSHVTSRNEWRGQALLFALLDDIKETIKERSEK